MWMTPLIPHFMITLLMIHIPRLIRGDNQESEGTNDRKYNNSNLFNATLFDSWTLSLNSSAVSAVAEITFLSEPSSATTTSTSPTNMSTTLVEEQVYITSNITMQPESFIGLSTNISVPSPDIDITLSSSTEIPSTLIESFAAVLNTTSGTLSSSTEDMSTLPPSPARFELPSSTSTQVPPITVQLPNTVTQMSQNAVTTTRTITSTTTSIGSSTLFPTTVVNTTDMGILTLISTNASFSLSAPSWSATLTITNLTAWTTSTAATLPTTKTTTTTTTTTMVALPSAVPTSPVLITTNTNTTVSALSPTGPEMTDTTLVRLSTTTVPVISTTEMLPSMAATTVAPSQTQSQSPTLTLASTAAITVTASSMPPSISLSLSSLKTTTTPTAVATLQQASTAVVTTVQSGYQPTTSLASNYETTTAPAPSSTASVVNIPSSSSQTPSSSFSSTVTITTASSTAIAWQATSEPATTAMLPNSTTILQPSTTSTSTTMMQPLQPANKITTFPTASPTIAGNAVSLPTSGQIATPALVIGTIPALVTVMPANLPRNCSSPTTQPVQQNVNGTVVRHYQGNFTITNAVYQSSLSNVNSPDYLKFYDIVFALLVESYTAAIPEAFLTLNCVSFSPGSVVVTSQFDINTNLTDVMIQTIKSQIENVFERSNFEVDEDKFAFQPLGYNSAPSPDVSPYNNVLLYVLTSSLISVAIIIVVIVVILLCRRYDSFHCTRSHSPSTDEHRRISDAEPAQEVYPDPALQFNQRSNAHRVWMKRTPMTGEGEIDTEYLSDYLGTASKPSHHSNSPRSVMGVFENKPFSTESVTDSSTIFPFERSRRQLIASNHSDENLQIQHGTSNFVSSLHGSNISSNGRLVDDHEPWMTRDRPLARLQIKKHQSMPDWDFESVFLPKMQQSSFQLMSESVRTGTASADTGISPGGLLLQQPEAINSGFSLNNNSTVEPKNLLEGVSYNGSVTDSSGIWNRPGSHDKNSYSRKQETSFTVQSHGRSSSTDPGVSEEQASTVFDNSDDVLNMLYGGLNSVRATKKLTLRKSSWSSTDVLHRSNVSESTKGPQKKKLNKTSQ